MPTPSNRAALICCSICIEHFKSDMPISKEVITPCGHIYHEKCLLRWFNSCQSTTNCPDCRSKFNCNEIKRVFFNFINDDCPVHQKIAEHDGSLGQWQIKRQTIHNSSDELSNQCQRISDSNHRCAAQTTANPRQCTLAKQIEYVDGQLNGLAEVFHQMESDINDIGQRLNSCERMLYS